MPDLAKVHESLDAAVRVMMTAPRTSERHAIESLIGAVRELAGPKPKPEPKRPWHWVRCNREDDWCTMKYLPDGTWQTSLGFLRKDVYEVGPMIPAPPERKKP